MESIEDVILRWYTEAAMTDEEVKYCEEFLEEGIHKDEVHDYKYVTYSEVYKDKSTGKFYEAWTQRTDTGYWGDSDKVDEGCYEVISLGITKTIYVAKENK